MDLSGTNGSLDSDWSGRDLPSDNLWSALRGAPWEIEVALANETGKDLYINVPSNVSISYITDLADLFAYGSNGVTPYTSVQQDPVWKPLDPNLKVYIEFSNEIWNSSFTQSESRSDGWANQLSQRALYDFLTDNQNESLYPGGGDNAYQDGAILASYYDVTSSNDSAFLATYNASAQAAGDGGSPLYFNNSASINGYSVGQGWVGLRDEQISAAFKTAFGEDDISAVATSSRVRPVFEWQSGGGWDGALAFINTVYGAQHPVSYYLYGGGGAWYSSSTNGGFSDVSFVNPAFASGLNGWVSSGTAGVAANGSSLSNPNAPPLFSAIAISNGATESGNTVTITTTTQQYFAVGQSVDISGVTVGGYNGTYTITAVTPKSFTYQDTKSGLASSGDGIVTGTSSSSQTAYLQPGASLSQTVTFSGGYADITLYATQNVAADGSDGLSITLTPTNGGPAINNGQPIEESEGAPAFSGVPNAFVWGRTEAFYTGSSAYTYTVTFSDTLPSGTVFFDNVAIQTVNGMFNETDAARESGADNISSAVESDVNIAKQYGLYEVGYEGGYSFGQNLSGSDDLNGYKDMGIQGYSSTVPNVGMYANLDPRTVALAAAALDQFYSAGGTLAIEYESAYNINSWGVAAPTYYNWNTPKVQATASVEQESQPATYGVTVGQPGTSVYWWLNVAQGNTVENTYLLPYGTYEATVKLSTGWFDTPATQIDPVEVLVDGVVVDTFNVSPLTGGTFTVPLGTLTAGQHGIGLVNAAPASNLPIGLGPGNPILTVNFASSAAIADPDFQPLTVGSGQYQYDPSGSAWAFSGSAGISGNDSAFTSGNPPDPQGSQVAFLQSGGSMSQTVLDWAAGSYVITFDAAQRGNFQASRENLSVLIDDRIVDTFTPSGTSYQSYTTAPFTVTAGMQIITFQGVDSAGGDNTIFLGQISLAKATSAEIGDPGFEQVVVGAGQYQYDPSGSSWVFSGSSGVSGNNSAFTKGNPPAPEASQVAFIQSQGSFSQSVSNWIAGSYVLTFEAAQRSNYQASKQNFSVLVDGTVVGTFTPSNSSYQSYSTTAFSVIACVHTITFQGLNSAGGDNTAFLDQVSLTQVSSPQIRDPDFEQVVVGTGHFEYDPTGSPWTFSGTAGISGNSSGFTGSNPPAPQGSQVAFIQSDGSFSQTVSNWVAGTYILTFEAAQRGSNQASEQNFSVLIDGTVVGTFTPSSSSYQSYSTLVFTVTAGAHTITFQGLDSAGGDNTAMIDDVQIV